MGMFYGGAGGGADVLEEHAVNEARVLFQVHQPVAIDPEHLADVFFREVGQGQLVKRAFDNDLVGPDAVHLVVNAFAALVEIALDLQSGELVGHDPDAPAALVGPRITIAVSQDLLRRLLLVPLAKRAIAAGCRRRLRPRDDRPLGAVGGDDHPAPHNRILTQFRHRQAPQRVGKIPQLSVHGLHSRRAPGDPA